MFLPAKPLSGIVALLALGFAPAALAQTPPPQQTVILDSSATTVNTGPGNATTIQNNIVIVPSAPAPRRSGSWGLSGSRSSRPTPSPTPILIIIVNETQEPLPEPCRGHCRGSLRLP